jgi:hypothetical protein
MGAYRVWINKFPEVDDPVMSWLPSDGMVSTPEVTCFPGDNFPKAAENGHRQGRRQHGSQDLGSRPVIVVKENWRHTGWEGCHGYVAEPRAGKCKENYQDRDDYFYGHGPHPLGEGISA